MEQQVARIISRIFNPLAISTYYLFIMFNLRVHFSTAIPEKARWMILGLVFITTYILPGLLLNIFGLVVRKSQRLKVREERMVALIISALFYVLSYYLLSQIQLSPIFSLFILGAASLVIIGLVISLFWQVSMYTMGMGALFGAFLGLHFTLHLDMTIFLLLTLVIGGATGYARLRLGKHTPAQIYSGFVLGAAAMFINFLFF